MTNSDMYHYARITCEKCGKKFEVGRFRPRRAGNMTTNDACPQCGKSIMVVLNKVREA